MNIYLVSRITKVSYDEYDAHVLYAEDAQSALALATSAHASEHEQGWHGATVELLASDVGDHDGIILSSFNAG